MTILEKAVQLITNPHTISEPEAVAAYYAFNALNSFADSALFTEEEEMEKHLAILLDACAEDGGVFSISIALKKALQMCELRNKQLETENHEKN